MVLTPPKELPNGRSDWINVFTCSDVTCIGLESRRLVCEEDKEAGTNWVEKAITGGFIFVAKHSWMSISPVNAEIDRRMTAEEWYDSFKLITIPLGHSSVKETESSFWTFLTPNFSYRTQKQGQYQVSTQF